MDKFVNILFICLVALFAVSSVSAAENDTDILMNSNYQISSDTSNDDIQVILDNAQDGDTFEFTDKEYKNISLVVDRKVNIISKEKSVIYTSNQISDKAKSLNMDNSFGFYFTSNSCGSILSGIKLMMETTLPLTIAPSG